MFDIDIDIDSRWMSSRTCSEAIAPATSLPAPRGDDGRGQNKGVHHWPKFSKGEAKTGLSSNRAKPWCVTGYIARAQRRAAGCFRRLYFGTGW